MSRPIACATSRVVARRRYSGRWLWLALLLAGASHAAPRDIVFLLGADVPGRKPYFSVAAAYFERAEPDTRQVASLGSLAEVREYLVRHRGPLPWRRVTLVSHGAPWIGLHTPVFVEGPEASLDRIEDARDSGEFPPLPPGTFDADTRVRLDSCGLGRRPDFLAALGRLFSPAEGAPTQIESSEQFVAYRVDADQALRFELPFAAAVIRMPAHGIDPALRQAAVTRLRQDLQQQAGTAAVQAAELETLPIRIGITLADRAPDRPAQLKARLARDPAVSARLAAHGLVLSQLDWQVTQAGSRVEGQALLLLLRAQPTAP